MWMAVMAAQLRNRARIQVLDPMALALARTWTVSGCVVGGTEMKTQE